MSEDGPKRTSTEPTFIDPRVAYSIERNDCRVNAHGDAEAFRQCSSMVDRKYARYWSEGDYPPPPTSTPGPETQQR